MGYSYLPTPESQKYAFDGKKSLKLEEVFQDLLPGYILFQENL
jgi:hypothetical protein